MMSVTDFISALVSKRANPQTQTPKCNEKAFQKNGSYFNSKGRTKPEIQYLISKCVLGKYGSTIYYENILINSDTFKLVLHIYHWQE